MPAFVALLRGIAPMNPKMRNAELRGVFERLGFDEVRTVISSGNVLFATPERAPARLADRIEAALHDHLGAPCTTILRSRRQIERLAVLDVFDGLDDGPTEQGNVTFLKRRPTSAQAPPDDVDGARVLAVRDGAVFTVVDTTNAGAAAIMRSLERSYGKEITTRTWKTVHRIAAAFAR